MGAAADSKAASKKRFRFMLTISSLAWLSGVSAMQNKINRLPYEQQRPANLSVT